MIHDWSGKKKQKTLSCHLVWRQTPEVYLCFLNAAEKRKWKLNYKIHFKKWKVIRTGISRCFYLFFWFSSSWVSSFSWVEGYHHPVWKINSNAENQTKIIPFMLDWDVFSSARSYEGLDGASHSFLGLLPSDVSLSFTWPPSPPVSAVMSLKCVMPLSWLDIPIMPLFLAFFWFLGMLRRTIIDSS